MRFDVGERVIVKYRGDSCCIPGETYTITGMCETGCVYDDFDREWSGVTYNLGEQYASMWVSPLQIHHAIGTRDFERVYQDAV